jgi:hypothetical protein
MSNPTSLKSTLSSYELADALARIPPDQKLPAALVAQISPRALKSITDNRVIWTRFGDQQYVKRTVSQTLQGHEQSREIQLEATELDAIASGGVKLISLISIFRRLFRLAVEAYPLDGRPPPRIRTPPRMYAPSRLRGRPRTKQRESDGVPAE